MRLLPMLFVNDNPIAAVSVLFALFLQESSKNPYTQKMPELKKTTDILVRERFIYPGGKVSQK